MSDEQPRDKENQPEEWECRYCPCKESDLDSLLTHLQGAHGVQNPL